MKKICITTLVLCWFSTAFAQQDLIDKVANQAVEIEKLKEELQTIQSQLKQKSDSTISLKSASVEKDIQIANVQQEANKKAEQRYNEGKVDAVSSIIRTYERKSFDELIRSSTKGFVQRDKQLVDGNVDVKQKLLDLDIYFSVKELFENKLDEYKINNVQTQLDSIQRKSELLDKLRDNLENYKTYSDGLKASIKKIIEIDRKEIAEGNDFVQTAKLNKILAEISLYFFNYDFNFEDYPYLSDIILEIMKRKQPNADADISDLLNKL